MAEQDRPFSFEALQVDAESQLETGFPHSEKLIFQGKVVAADNPLYVPRKPIPYLALNGYADLSVNLMQALGAWREATHVINPAGVFVTQHDEQWPFGTYDQIFQVGEGSTPHLSAMHFHINRQYLSIRPLNELSFGGVGGQAVMNAFGYQSELARIVPGFVAKDTGLEPQNRDNQIFIAQRGTRRITS